MKGAGVRKQFVDIIEPIRAAFGDAASPDPRDTQYFELWGSRGIWHKGWKAAGMHAPGTDFDKDRWELHDVRNDFSESVDLASQQPARLEEMKKLWRIQARKYGVLRLLEAPGMRYRTYDQALPKNQ
jgi:arylsulfatase